MRKVHVAPQTARVTCDGCQVYPAVPAAAIIYTDSGNYISLCLDCAAFVRLALGHRIDKAVESPSSSDAHDTEAKEKG
jgi:RNase P subunit RPR2